MSAPKKQRNFQYEWKEQYGFIERGDRVICCLCSESVVARTSSVKRHYQTKHESNHAGLGPSEKREVIRQCVIKFETQKSAFSKFVRHGEHVTTASYITSLAIAKAGKPFTDGDFIKNTLILCGKELFQDFSDRSKIMGRIEELPLSARTVQRRIEEMASDVTTQVQNDMQVCSVLSLALDESTDNNDVSRLAIIARFHVEKDKHINEELCALFPMTGTTKGVDVLNAVKKFVRFSDQNNLDLKAKLFSVTTDGAPSMTGKHNGFVKLLEEELGRPLLSFHCVIHQENLCAKTSGAELKQVMTTVVNIVNTIIARSALVHRRFKTLLDEMECQYGDLLLHCAVRWLSAGNVLSRFVECLHVIVFLKEIGKEYPELEDPVWKSKLMFLTDITCHLNELNKRLQGKKFTVLCAFEEWKSFCKKLDIFKNDIQSKKFQYFPKLKILMDSEEKDDIDIETISSYISKLTEEFHQRFQDLQQHGPMFKFIVKPEETCISDLELQYFNWMDVKNLEMELVDFQASDIWTDKFKDLRENLASDGERDADKIAACWASLPPKFSSLKKVAFALLSAFGSSYTCEQVFSHMKNILGPVRSRLTLNNSENCVKLKVSAYNPDIHTLSAAKQHQGSH